MRSLSDALLAAQSTPDPLATVTARFKRRGTFAGDPLAWRPLFLHGATNLPYGDVNVTAAACACAENGAMVRVLRSAAAGKVGVQRLNMLGWSGTGASWPAAAVSALTAAPTQVAALAYTDDVFSTPGIGRINNSMYVFYGDRGLVRVVNSANDGVTWGNFSNAWDGRAVYTRCSNFGVCGAGASGAGWMAVFNGYDVDGHAHVRAVYSIGAGWVVTTELPADGIDWQVAGVRRAPVGDPCVYVYLWGVKAGYSVLACQRMATTAAGAFSAWDGAPQVVDRAGSVDGVLYDRARFGDAGGAYLFALQERAVKGYWFVSALFGLPGSRDIEEPVYLADADLSPAVRDVLTPLQAGARSWLVGAGGVYASAQADTPANLSVRSYAPTSYTYTAEANGGGVLQLQIERSVSGDAANETSFVEGFGTVAQPEVYVGDILWLDRSLSTGTAGGTMTLAFRVVQVAYTRERVEVLAADALGVLAHMRPRRPKWLPAGERTRLADVDAFCHWVGLDVSGSGALPQAAWPSPGFVWEANESGLGALRRYLADQVIALRAGGADTEQAHTRVALLALPSSSSYVYVSPSGLAEGLGTHEIADWRLELDSRQARLYVANGLATAGDPLGADGAKAWAITAARMLPGARPYPLSSVDYSFAASDGRLQELSKAQAQWLLFGLPLGEIEAVANLGVEMYDVVTVDQTEARVVGIVERWDRGSLRQRSELAEVDAFGVSVG